MPKATQFCVGLDNKPGTLAKMCSTLKRAKVNIDAITVSDNAECCWARFIASPAATARKALTRGRFDFCTRPVLRLQVADKPGELERVAAKLAKAGINMNYVYGSNPKAKSSTLVISTSDPNRAARLLGG